MIKQELVDYFLNKPKQLQRSAGKFVRGERGGEIFNGCTIQDVNDAKKQARDILNNKFTEEIKEKVIESLKTTELETDHKTGNQRFTIESDKPLSPKELETLVGADNISTFVDRSWLKSHKNGTWTYSILTICKIKDFYTTVELDAKLKEIFKNVKYTPLTLPSETKIKREKALFIYIADDHAGLVLKDSLYNREYSGSTYAQRLLQVVEEVKNLDKLFSHIYVIRLGDEMDGWNGKTTRYDHSLGSLSNKEQFDIYTIANQLFYTELFNCGQSHNYTLYTLGNSNHTGLGFSYIANKALEFWLEGKFPFVNVIHQEKFIDVIEYGNHIIGLTHGKDDRDMKAPMPLNLDFKTDLWLMDYYKQYQQQGKFVHLIKGDIHKYNVNQGKFGRYLNVPSISSGSNWIEKNYGDSKPGVLLEIYSENSENIQAIPIWF